MNILLGRELAGGFRGLHSVQSLDIKGIALIDKMLYNLTWAAGVLAVLRAFFVIVRLVHERQME